jgi:hypothetical protein
LEENTGKRFGQDIRRWYEWIWSRPAQDHPRYAEFKGRLYRHIDPKFGAYFALDRPVNIRLDEVRWGGVRQDGIPPLRSPEMIGGAEATYLDDDNVVFGLDVNGDVRAYPKRILAWHELFTDKIGGVPVAGVYCTLCGTVILYETELDGVRYELGTSGFLYRSNKLMYDRATQSLWNTIWGRPAIGPLAQEPIQLKRRSVVTTTWGEWRRRHPTTRVLSLNTGHRRDYSEGAAYREYFATDDLMFNVPKLDRRLKNKDEVLTLVLDEEAARPLAISADFLAKNPLRRQPRLPDRWPAIHELGPRPPGQGRGRGHLDPRRESPGRVGRPATGAPTRPAGLLVRLVRSLSEHPTGEVAAGKDRALEQGVRGTYR